MVTHCLCLWGATVAGKAALLGLAVWAIGQADGERMMRQIVALINGEDPDNA